MVKQIYHQESVCVCMYMYVCVCVYKGNQHGAQRSPKGCVMLTLHINF